MNRLILIVITVFILVSCKEKTNIEEIEISKVEVYYIPFDVLTPTQSEERSIRSIKSYLIDDNPTLENLKSEFKNLTESEFKKFNKNSIYLLCDFYDKDGKAFTLKFDKQFIMIDNIEYNNNESLIKTLIKKGVDNWRNWGNEPKNSSTD